MLIWTPLTLVLLLAVGTRLSTLVVLLPSGSLLNLTTLSVVLPLLPVVVGKETAQ